MIYDTLDYKSTVAHIDLSAIRHNYKIIKQRTPNSKILAVVKSNAYGHGITPITKTLNPLVDAFAVAWLDEAIEIFENNIKKPILLLKGFITPKELQLISSLKFNTVIHNFHQIELIEKTPLTHPLNIWLKIDTGMHRLGFQPQEFIEVYQRLINNPKIATPIRLMSHFASAEDVNNKENNKQLEIFNNISENFSIEKTIANSAALWSKPEAQFDWVRPGILLYGASPFSDKNGLDLGLKPAMTLTSQLLTIQSLKKGNKIGYNGTWTCPEDMPIGLVNLGYGDGYPRHAEIGTPVLINSCRCPIVGRISMDMLAIDLRPCQKINSGDKVILWGKELPIEEIARYSGTIPHELLCHFTQRVKIKYRE